MLLSVLLRYDHYLMEDQRIALSSTSQSAGQQETMNAISSNHAKKKMLHNLFIEKNKLVLKLCKSHVCKAPQEWLKLKETKARCKNISNLNRHFLNFFRDVMSHVTTMDHISMVIPALAVIESVLRTEQFSLVMNANTPRRTESHKPSLNAIGKEIKNFIYQEAASLVESVATEDKFKQHLLDAEARGNQFTNEWEGLVDKAMNLDLGYAYFCKDKKGRDEEINLTIVWVSTISLYLTLTLAYFTLFDIDIGLFHTIVHTNIRSNTVPSTTNISNARGCETTTAKGHL